jgi:hypothetical protein
MNLHDKTMCGWAMLNISDNKEIWDILYKSYKKSVVDLINIVIGILNI